GVNSPAAVAAHQARNNTMGTMNPTAGLTPFRSRNRGFLAAGTAVVPGVLVRFGLCWVAVSVCSMVVMLIQYLLHFLRTPGRTTTRVPRQRSPGYPRLRR